MGPAEHDEIRSIVATELKDDRIAADRRHGEIMLILEELRKPRQPTRDQVVGALRHAFNEMRKGIWLVFQGIEPWPISPIEAEALPPPPLRRHLARVASRALRPSTVIFWLLLFAVAAWVWSVFFAR